MRASSALSLPLPVGVRQSPVRLSGRHARPICTLPSRYQPCVVRHLGLAVRAPCAVAVGAVPAAQRGFQSHHDGRLITVFSASNYCGRTGNYGAVCIFSPDCSFQIEVGRPAVPVPPP